MVVCGTLTCGGTGFIGTGNPVTQVDGQNRDASVAGSGYAIFTVYEKGPAGSGYINPFLRFQHNEQTANGSDVVETAYNTDNDDLQSLNDGNPDYNYQNQAKDTTAGGQKDGDFNRALLYSNLLADDDGYFTFLLDINEPNEADKSLLRLDELSFFISTSNTLGVYQPGCTSADPLTNTAGSKGCFKSSDNDGATTAKVWDMDLDKIIGSLMLDNVNASGKAGSGDYDLQVKLPTYLFDAFVAQYGTQDLYVYLENTAGKADNVTDTAGGEAQAGFEEWAVIEKKPGQVPVPGTLLLTGIGLLLLGRRVYS